MGRIKIFTSILTLLVLVVCYLIMGLWGLIEIKNNKDLIFSSKSNLEFHKKYSDQIHHLRDVNSWGVEQNDYLFSLIHLGKQKSKTILFQGDSWIEDISRSKLSKDFLKKYGEKNNYNIYNGGITSFAPSVMHSQYKILKNDFKINPDILIIYIDQTDIGDEHCRYKHNKIYNKEGKFIRVQREKFTRATYDYSKIYIYSELNDLSVFKKIIKFPYLKTNYFFQRNFNLINQIILEGFENRNKSKCGFQEIMKELITYDVEAERSFKTSFKDYLNHLTSDNNLKKVLIVSFPHINHHKKIYRVNVSKYIDEVLKETDSSLFEHLNLNKLNFDEVDIQNVYRKNDLGSHLSDEYHVKFFLKNILKNVKQN